MHMHVNLNKKCEDLSYEYCYYWDPFTVADDGSCIVPRMEGVHYKAQLLKHISASRCKADQGAS
jgi:hypothetical protein